MLAGKTRLCDHRLRPLDQLGDADAARPVSGRNLAALADEGKLAPDVVERAGIVLRRSAVSGAASLRTYSAVRYVELLLGIADPEIR